MDEVSGGPAVGLVGAPAAVRTTVSETDLTTVSGDAEAVLSADPALVVAVGESSLLTLARLRPDPPILAVEAGPGVGSIPQSAVADALSRIAGGDVPTTTHPLLGVAIDGEHAGLACVDATLVAAEPARISAFDVRGTAGLTGSVRADGVVVATPAGTAGYAARLDAPTVAPGTGVVAVEPIAQFATAPDRWVLPDDDVTVTVRRDEVPVEVVADDRVVGQVAPGEPVSIGRDGTIETVVVPGESASLGGRGGELEKH